MKEGIFMTFKEQFLKGFVDIKDINDAVDTWHTDDKITVELHEYLGLNEEEYTAWIKGDNCLKKKLLNGKEGV